MVTMPFESRLRSLISELAELIADLPVFAPIRWPAARRFIRLEDEMNEDRYEVRAEIPGIGPNNDVDVTVRDGQLTTKAERRKIESIGRSEFGYGSFVRSVSLPDGADPDGITTTYDKGILTVAVPVSESDPAVEDHRAVHAVD
jgi:HSP20 family protein